MRGLRAWVRPRPTCSSRPRAPRASAAARVHGQGHLADRPELTLPPGFHLAFICLPHPNWLQICHFGGAATQPGRALGRPGTPEQCTRASAWPGPRGDRATGGELAVGPGLSALTPLPWALAWPSPRGAQRNCLGARTASSRSGRLGEGSPGPLGALGSGRGGQRSAHTGSQALRPGQPRRSALPGGRDHPRSRRRGNPVVAEAWGRCGSGALPGLRSTTILNHCPQWGDPKSNCSEPARPPVPRAPGLPQRLGPAGAGHRRGRAPRAQGPVPKARKWKLFEKNPQIRPGPKPTSLHKAPGARPRPPRLGVNNRRAPGQAALGLAPPPGP